MKLNIKSSLIISIFTLFSFFSYAHAEIKVVASIKPIHSLVSYIMDGVGTPSILVDGSSSPHTFQLKPSHAQMLQDADIVFWIGEDLESFLETPLESIATNAKKITLMELDDIELLKFREKHIFEEHAGHDDHGDEHDEHEEGHDEHEEGHDEHEEGHDEHEDEHGHHDGHNHGEFDIHFWLDPVIAKVIVKNVAEELSNIDVANKATYEANASKAISELDELIAGTKLKINKDATYVVFHDAYQYFEERFGIEVLGALSVNPEILPGAKQLAEIREVIEHENVNCIFSEPQFNPSIAKTIAADTGVKAAVLDPLGAELDPGKDLYFDLIADMASSFSGC
ncbi:zinc ABC transporter substrate-binding protein ZnuA [Pelagibacteraceae bacterium]|nr:zinc ABC transporter substrate-binding protein ZnuA [Pelagibacteraceae bacterium]